MNEDYTQQIGFWKRLKSFVSETQVNCMTGDEEKEMIISNCDLKIKEYENQI